jgi:type I restriction enzyme, S subunit
MSKDPIIRHVESILAGTWGEEPDDSTNTVLCLRVADFNYSRLTNSDIKTKRKISTSDVRQKLLNDGDILIEKSGGGEKTPVGRAILTSGINEPTTYANFIERIRLKPSLEPRYANYILSHLYSRKINTKYIKQNTGIQNLDVKSYLSELIEIPEIEKQVESVAYLDSKTQTIDKMLEAKNKTRTYLSELRQAIITESVYPTGGNSLRGSDQLYRHLVSQESGTWGEDPSGKNEVRCLRVADFDYEHLSHVEPMTVRSIATAHMRTKILKQGDILIEKSGGGEKTPVGRAIMVGKLGESTTYANFIDRLRFKNSVIPEYALYLLYAMYAGGVNTKYIKQNTGIQNLDIKHYLMEPVSVPDASNQRKIVHHIQARLKKIDHANSRVEKSIEYLKEYRSALITNVVGGKVEV